MSATATIDAAINLAAFHLQKQATDGTGGATLRGILDTVKGWGGKAVAAGKGLGTLEDIKSKATGFWNQNQGRIKDDAMYGAAGAGGLALMSAATAYRRPGESEGDYRKRRFRETLSSIVAGGAIGAGVREGYNYLSGEASLWSPEGVYGRVSGLQKANDPKTVAAILAERDAGKPSSVDARGVDMTVRSLQANPDFAKTLAANGVDVPAFRKTFMAPHERPGSDHVVNPFSPGGETWSPKAPEMAPGDKGWEGDPDPSKQGVVERARSVLGGALPQSVPLGGSALTGAATGGGLAQIGQKRFSPADYLQGKETIAGQVSKARADYESRIAKDMKTQGVGRTSVTGYRPDVEHAFSDFDAAIGPHDLGVASSLGHGVATRPANTSTREGVMRAHGRLQQVLSSPVLGGQWSPGATALTPVDDQLTTASGVPIINDLEHKRLVKGIGYDALGNPIRTGAMDVAGGRMPSMAAEHLGHAKGRAIRTGKGMATGGIVGYLSGLGYDSIMGLISNNKAKQDRLNISGQNTALPKAEPANPFTPQ